MDMDSDEDTVRILVNSLLCAAKYVQEELQLASQSIEQICKSTDAQIIQLVLSVSEKEENVRQSQEAVNQANNNLHHAQHQVVLAETAARDGQHSLDVANQAVHVAHEAVTRARNCGIGRRKKRFLGELKKIFRNVVVKPVCRVINSGGIDNAKERRALADQHLYQVRERLRTHQQNLAHEQAKHNAAQTHLHNANIQLQIITSTLNKQRTQQLLLTNLSKQFKDVEVHLKTILSSSTA